MCKRIRQYATVICKQNTGSRRMRNNLNRYLEVDQSVMHLSSYNFLFYHNNHTVQYPTHFQISRHCSLVALGLY